MFWAHGEPAADVHLMHILSGEGEHPGRPDFSDAVAAGLAISALIILPPLLLPLLPLLLPFLVLLLPPSVPPPPPLLSLLLLSLLLLTPPPSTLPDRPCAVLCFADACGLRGAGPGGRPPGARSQAPLLFVRRGHACGRLRGRSRVGVWEEGLEAVAPGLRGSDPGPRVQGAGES